MSKKDKNVMWLNKISPKSVKLYAPFLRYILQKTPLKLVNWFLRYEQLLKDAKNNRKQKKFSALFGSILKSKCPTSDWFGLITSQMWSDTVEGKLDNYNFPCGQMFGVFCFKWYTV